MNGVGRFNSYLHIDCNIIVADNEKGAYNIPNVVQFIHKSGRDI